jgi:hypothetical protein
MGNFSPETDHVKEPNGDVKTSKSRDENKVRKRGNIQKGKGCEDVCWIQLAWYIMEYSVLILALFTIPASVLQT